MDVGVELYHFITGAIFQDRIVTEVEKEQSVVETTASELVHWVSDGSSGWFP